MGKLIVKDKRNFTVQKNWSSGQIQFSDALLKEHIGTVVEVEFIVRKVDANEVVQETEK